MSRLLFWLSYLWALPNTVIGLVVCLFGAALPKKLEAGALLCVAQPGGLCERFFASFRFAGFTLGGVIVLANEGLLQNAKLLDHEQRHFWQARVFGPLFLPLYYLASLWAWVRGRKLYEDNAFEIDARKAAA